MNASLSSFRLRELRLLVLMTLLVCAGAWISTQLSLAVGTVSSIWVGNGIIAAFVLTAPGRWKIAFFVAGQLANLGVDLVFGNTLYRALWFVVCNCSDVLITALSLRHFHDRSEMIGKRALQRVGLFGVFLGPLTGALLASPLASSMDGRPILDSFRIWFLAGALGSAATLPLLLFLMTGEGESARPLRTRAADFAWAVFLAGTTLAVFWQTRYPVLFLLFPPLVAVLFRFRLAGAVYGTSVVVAIAAAFTAEAHGPFALFPGTTPTERVALFQIFGLLMFASCIPLGFSIEERNRLDAQLKQAIANLADLAFLDSLTGVRNRRGLDAAMESEWLIACATGSELSLLYLDIDFFKRFNDTYGHQRGDDCLRSVARILLAGVRESGDCVARYGGEEFVILLPATSAAAARTTAERIFAAMRALQVPHKGSPLGIVTASFGIATIRPSAGGNPYGLIGLADDALYAAKRGGRDRIVAKYGTDPGVTTVAPAPAAIAEAATPFGLW